MDTVHLLFNSNHYYESICIEEYKMNSKEFIEWAVV